MFEFNNVNIGMKQYTYTSSLGMCPVQEILLGEGFSISSISGNFYSVERFNFE